MDDLRSIKVGNVPSARCDERSVFTHTHTLVHVHSQRSSLYHLSVWASHGGAVFMTPYYRSSVPHRYRSWMYTFDQRSTSGARRGGERGEGRDTQSKATGRRVTPVRVRDWTWVRDLHRNRSRNHPEATSGVHGSKRERERVCRKKGRGSAEDRLCTWPPRTRSLAKVEQRLTWTTRLEEEDDLTRLCISDFYSSSISSLFASVPLRLYSRVCVRACFSLVFAGSSPKLSANGTCFRKFQTNLPSYLVEIYPSVSCNLYFLRVFPL